MSTTAYATLVSVGVHGALALTLASVPEAWLDEERVESPIEITIVTPRDEPAERMDEPAPEAVPRPEPEPEVRSDRPQRPAALVVRPSIDPVPTEEGASSDPSETASTIELPEVEPAAGEQRPDPRDPRMRALLDPTAVARRSFRATGPGPSRPSGPAGLDRGGRGPLTEEEAEARHRDFLRRRAMAKSYITRERPELHRQPDGSYRYQGPRMTAVILRDGDVRFDHSNGSVDLARGRADFDLTDALMSASGQNPHQADEDWFMRHTAELRERLEREHRQRAMARAVRRIRGRLSRLWSDDSHDESWRRREIFRIWDDMAEDGSADAARAQVIAYVREALPRGSGREYTEAELARLNRGRSSSDRFDPY